MIHSGLVKSKSHPLNPVWQFMPQRCGTFLLLAIYTYYYNTRFLSNYAASLLIASLAILGSLEISFIICILLEIASHLSKTLLFPLLCFFLYDTLLLCNYIYIFLSYWRNYDPTIFCTAIQH